MKRLFAVLESPVTRVILLGLVALSLQTTIFNTLRPFDVVLQVMLLFAVCSGVAGGSENGALAGFAFGFMYDLILTTPLGLSGVVFGFAGYMAGWANVFVHEPKWWFKIASVMVSTATAVVLFPAACLVVGIDGLLDSRVVTLAFTCAIFNGIFALPVSRLMKWALVKPVRQAVWAE